jgi:hypothetical protein
MIIVRKYEDDGTFGKLSYKGLELDTLELPDKENEPNISCIPEGEYNLVLWESPKFGQVIKIQNVIARSDILIHAGNTLGDTQGCILVGVRAGNRLVASKLTLEKLLNVFTTPTRLYIGTDV